MIIIEVNGYVFVVMCCFEMDLSSGENFDCKVVYRESIMIIKFIFVIIRKWEFYYLEKNESFLGNCILEEFYKM